jgi:hypothetical protein
MQTFTKLQIHHLHALKNLVVSTSNETLVLMSQTGFRAAVAAWLYVMTV